VVERGEPNPTDDAAYAAFGALATSAPHPAQAPADAGRPKAAPRKAIRTVALVVGGLLWTAAVVAFGVVLLWPRTESGPPSAAPITPPSPAQVVSSASSAPAPPKSNASPPAVAPDQSHRELALKTDPGPKPGVDLSAAEGGPVAGRRHTGTDPERLVPSKIEVASRERPPTEKTPREAASPHAPSPRFPEPTRFKFGSLARRPINVKEKLNKILEAPLAHAAKVIIPAGMYELARSSDDQREGLRKYAFTERRFESPSTRPGAKFYLISGATTEIEVEPKLAAQLDRLSPNEWEKKPAILTLGITESGDCGVVGLAILENSFPRLRGGMVPDIVYETLAVTPEGSKPTIGDDKDWESERVYKLARYYKGQLRAFKQRFETMQMSQVQSQMGTIWTNVMREAAAQDAAQRALQRGVGGR